MLGESGVASVVEALELPTAEGSSAAIAANSIVVGTAVATIGQLH